MEYAEQKLSAVEQITASFKWNETGPEMQTDYVYHYRDL